MQTPPRVGRCYLYEFTIRRDGVCNPVTHVFTLPELSSYRCLTQTFCITINIKRLGRGCKPRPALSFISSKYLPNSCSQSRQCHLVDSPLIQHPPKTNLPNLDFSYISIDGMPYCIGTIFLLWHFGQGCRFVDIGYLISLLVKFRRISDSLTRPVC